MKIHSFTSEQLEEYVAKRIHVWEDGGKAKAAEAARKLSRKEKLTTAGNFKVDRLPDVFSLECVADFELSKHSHETSHQDRRVCQGGSVYRIRRTSEGFGIKNSLQGRLHTRKVWWAYLTKEELLTYFKKVK
jgi:hypothetical protein